MTPSKGNRFRPRARLLALLGDQLIRNPGIAAFELAKNAYDADATSFTMTLHEPESPDVGTIIAADDGSGMSLETITSIWLEPGSPHREKQRIRGERSPRYNRLPMGEKGVGRFAVQKLGYHIELVTRARRKQELVVTIDWRAFTESEGYIDELPVRITRRRPKVFTGTRTGTRITVTALREAWTRGMVRELARSLTSIRPPFKTDDPFTAILRVPDHPDWLAGLHDVESIKREALFRVHGEIEGGVFRYEYEFTPPASSKLRGRTVSRTMSLERISAAGASRSSKSTAHQPLDLSLHKIGKVKIAFFMFDLASGTLSGVKDRQGLREYLAVNGGIRVYRDGVRVFDYGEPGNDWLDLEGRRINRPGQRLSNNLVIGAVSLDRSRSTDLLEKTNREGFVENVAYRDFAEAIQSAIVHVEAERNTDKMRLRQTAPILSRQEPVLEQVQVIREIAEQKGYLSDISPQLNRIEKDYLQVRDVLLVSANSGLSLTVVIHEVEKGLADLRRAVDADDRVSSRVRGIATRLSELVEGLAALARKDGQRTTTARELIEKATFNTSYRLKAHNIELISTTKGNFRLKVSQRLLIGTLMNLIDNSIWWLDHHHPKRKQLHVFPSADLSSGPALVIADNNTSGFVDPADAVVQPFFTRRPDGMGIGLHIASEVMHVHKGHIELIDAADVGLPSEFKAVVALVFPDAEWIR